MTYLYCVAAAAAGNMVDTRAIQRKNYYMPILLTRNANRNPHPLLSFFSLLKESEE